MAKSQETFSKKQREKQRLKKQQDKEEKRKERKGEKKEGKSLSDMMAYLDENGNLTDTPVDPSKKRVFELEDIPVGVPKLEERAPDEPRTGIVAFFNEHKGFGFINDSETRERIFVHVNELSAPIKENDKVSYIPERGPKGPIATNVTLVQK
ncbi:MAG: cold shock domain-containing protein [Candidatus Pseudobacter hemicellulosilyticus]|uniref:Cold shock domain-containing protein n=1 Tax=Candidatus Pseudobacter hemicellulosilyticus TaxID=3121375 RepID=A0AAJ5WMZ7_9BACT|nr:MAG: cold shock domain-containing protein [Pseudobacter sp.]